ncbi:MAG: membrane protein insertion efficiency factor YidD [Candidatus Omnitrophota bacterium]
MLESIALNLIKGYQNYIRIYIPCHCRFSPSCSEYAYQAIARHGFIKGCIKAGRRLLRCHPLSKRSGYDPLV